MQHAAGPVPVSLVASHHQALAPPSYQDTQVVHHHQQQQPTQQGVGGQQMSQSLQHGGVQIRQVPTPTQSVTPQSTMPTTPTVQSQEQTVNAGDMQAQTENDKRAIYRHPLFPLMTLLFEKCEQATQSADPPTSASFDVDIETFVRHQEQEGKPFFSDDPEVDNLMVKAIQVLRIHLLELEKVNELCKDFCHRYITCLKGKMQSDNLLRNDIPNYPGGQVAMIPEQQQQQQQLQQQQQQQLQQQQQAQQQHNQVQQVQQIQVQTQPQQHLQQMTAPGTPIQSGTTGAVILQPNNTGQNPAVAQVQPTQVQTPTVTMATVMNAAGQIVYQPVTMVTPQGVMTPQGVVTPGAIPGTVQIQTTPPQAVAQTQQVIQTPIIHGSTPISQIGVPSQSSHMTTPTASLTVTPSNPTTFDTSFADVDLLNKRKNKRGVLPKQATNVMRSWLFQHIVHPYPTEDEKRQIAGQTNLTLLQVNNWFINARRRILQPMLDASNPDPTPKAKKNKNQSRPTQRFWPESLANVGIQQQDTQQQLVQAATTVAASGTDSVTTVALNTTGVENMAALQGATLSPMLGVQHHTSSASITNMVHNGEDNPLNSDNDDLGLDSSSSSGMVD